MAKNIENKGVPEPTTSYSDILTSLSLIFKNEVERKRLSELKSIKSSKELKKFVENVLGKKETGNEIFEDLVQDICDILENENLDEYEPCALYLDAEDAIMEDDFKKASKLYSKLILMLASKYEPCQIINNPIHICGLLGGYEKEDCDHRIVNHKVLSDEFKNTAISAQKMSELTVYVMVPCESCFECESHLDHYVSYYFLKCLLRKLECFTIPAEKQLFRKFIIDWMKTFEENEVIGYYQFTERKIFHEVLSKYLEERCKIEHNEHLLDYLRQINEIMDFESLVDEIDNDHLEDLEWIMDEFQKCSARKIEKMVDFKFIVNAKSERKIVNGVFYLQDLQTALKVAKDNDKIFVQEGIYEINTGYFEVKKSIEVVGEGHDKTIIKGPWAIKSSASFKKLKFEIGQDEQSKDAIYVMNGSVAKFELCHFVSPVNTLVYLLSSGNQINLKGML